MDIGIDTSALSNLLSLDDPPARLNGRLAPTDRLLVSMNVVDELLAQENVQKLEPRAHRLAELAAAMPQTLRFSPDGVSLVVHFEWRTRSHVGAFRTPTLSDPDVRRIVHHLARRDFASVHAPLAPAIRANLNKDFALAHDQSVRGRFPGGFSTPPTPQDLAPLLQGFASRILSHDSHFLGLATRSPRHRKRIRKQPQSYKSALMHASYMYIHALGSAMGDIGYPDNPGILRAPRGNAVHLALRPEVGRRFRA
jgi:hypothetical protein